MAGDAEPAAGGCGGCAALVGQAEARLQTRVRTSPKDQPLTTLRADARPKGAVHGPSPGAETSLPGLARGAFRVAGE